MRRRGADLPSETAAGLRERIKVVVTIPASASDTAWIVQPSTIDGFVWDRKTVPYQPILCH
eukprot:4807146-Pyramimonas_sp.AAC.1